MIQVAMTPEQFAAKCAQLKAEQGVEIVGTQGEMEKDGVRASYVYHEGELNVVVTKHPFYVPAAVCEQKIRAWLDTE